MCFWPTFPWQAGWTCSENDNISDNYFVSLATRYPGGFAIENYYDGKFHTSIGYGTTLSTNIYFGASYHTDDNYTVGLLLRPSNVFSIGITKHAQNNSDVKYNRGSIAIRPFEFIKLSDKPNTLSGLSNNNFIRNSNLTLGYEKVYNADDEDLYLKE